MAGPYRIMLVFAAVESDNFEDVVLPIQNWLADHAFGVLMRVDNLSGGDTDFETHVFLGAFKQLEISGFLSFVQQTPWRVPERVQVLVQEGDDQVFTVFQL